MTYTVIAHYTCAPKDADEVRDALLAMRAHTRQEAANEAYVVHEVLDEGPGRFMLYEQYTDRAGFDTHTAAPHFVQHIVGTVRPRLLERTVHFAQVI